MGRYGIGFNNQGFFTTYPTVFSNVDATQLDFRNQGPTGILALLGTGAGFFQPKVATSLPYQGGDPGRFLSEGSDLLVAAKFAVRPFPQLGRAVGQIYVVPVTAATKSTLNIQNNVPTTLVTITSKGWGLKFNSIKVAYTSGTRTCTIRILLDNGTYLTETYVHSVTTPMADLVAQINGRSVLCDATLVLEGTAVTLAETNMTGGTEPAAVTSDWTDAITALGALKVNVLHLATADTTVLAAARTYANDRRVRIFTGSATTRNWNGAANRATAITALKAEIAAINDPRVMHVCLGADGYAGYLSSARHAALAAALEPSVPMTQKQLGFTSLEARLDLYTEVGGVDGLLLAGGAPPVPDPNAPSTFIVSRGLSTWIGDDNLYNREHSVLAAVDGVRDLLESQLQGFLGGEGTAGVLGRIRERVESILRECTKPTSAIRINDYDPDSIVVSFTSDTVVRVVCKVTPIPPINFIAVTLNLQRTDITITSDINLAAAA